MKNFVVFTTLMASFFMINACTTHCNSPCATETAPCNKPVHQDLKGESR